MADAKIEELEARTCLLICAQPKSCKASLLHLKLASQRRKNNFERFRPVAWCQGHGEPEHGLCQQHEAILARSQGWDAVGHQLQNEQEAEHSDAPPAIQPCVFQMQRKTIGQLRASVAQLYGPHLRKGSPPCLCAGKSPMATSSMGMAAFTPVRPSSQQELRSRKTCKNRYSTTLRHITSREAIPRCIHGTTLRYYSIYKRTPTEKNIICSFAPSGGHRLRGTS